jgi:hypothetical protein
MLLPLSRRLALIKKRMFRPPVNASATRFSALEEVSDQLMSTNPSGVEPQVLMP